jgi:hypothetical protein
MTGGGSSDYVRICATAWVVFVVIGPEPHPGFIEVSGGAALGDCRGRDKKNESATWAREGTAGGNVASSVGRQSACDAMSV